MSNFLAKLFSGKNKKQFQEFDFRVAEFNLPIEGKIQYAQWLHPGEFKNHPGEAGNVVTQETVNFYKQFIKEGDTVIDVGAHEGDTTVPMALAAGKSGTAFAFEPNPHSFRVLSKNATLNEDKYHIRPLNFAATATDGEFTFGSGDASFGNGGIVGFTHNKKRNTRFTFQVTGKNIDQFLFTNHPAEAGKVALIKVDAEGYDKEILKTIPGLLDKNRPYVVVECFGPSTHDEKEELVALLSQRNYKAYRLSGFTTANMAEVTAHDIAGKVTFDILAVPNEKLSSLEPTRA